VKKRGNLYVGTPAVQAFTVLAHWKVDRVYVGGGVVWKGGRRKGQCWGGVHKSHYSANADRERMFVG